MRYSNIDERWGSLDLVMSGVTLMTSKFLPAFQNLIALFPGNEQGMTGRVLRRAETTPLHSTEESSVALPIPACFWWSLVVFPAPGDLEAEPFQHA